MKEEKTITAKQAHEALGLSKRLTTWINKKYGNRKETIGEWKKIFKKEISK